MADRPNILVQTIGRSNSTIVVRMLQQLGWHAGQIVEDVAEHEEVRKYNWALQGGEPFDLARASAILETLPRPWVLKNPDFCKTLPQWLPALEPYRPLLLWIVKPLSAVLESFERAGWNNDALDDKLADCQRYFDEWPWAKLKLEVSQIEAAVALFDVARSTGRIYKGDNMKIAVYTIAKNEAKHAERWAKSAEAADVRLVLDTGSTDDTVALLEAQGVTVEKATIDPWRFDAARNKALELLPADVDVCVSLDMDEELSDGWREAIEAAWTNDATALRHRLNAGTTWRGSRIHSRLNWQWVYPIHEVVSWCGAPGVACNTIDCDLTITHRPDNTKPRSYMPLLELAAREQPQEPRHAYYLGRELWYGGRYSEAIGEFNRYLKLPGATWPAERADVYRMMGKCYQQLGKDKQAKDHFYISLQHCPRRETWVDIAHHQYARGDFLTTYQAAKEALKFTEQSAEFFNEPYAWRELPHDLLATAAFHLGYYAESAEHAEIAAELAPKDERLQQNARAMRELAELHGGRPPASDAGTHRILLSIAIASLPSRMGPYLAELLQELERQAEGLPVEIVVLTDNRRRTIGAKRNELVRLAQGDFITQIDDDDLVAPDYVQTLLQTIQGNPTADVIVFGMIQTRDTTNVVPLKFGVEFKDAPFTDNVFDYSLPTHICCWRRELAATVAFPDIRTSEDLQWAREIAPRVKNQVRIERPLYHYRWMDDVSAARPDVGNWQRERKIPKIIHQIWIGPKQRPAELMDTWPAQHPDWTYMLWDEAAIAREFPDGLENQAAFDAIPEINGKADILRYEILRKYRGICIDADARCVRPLDDELLDNDAFVCYESERHRPGLIAAGFIGVWRKSRLPDLLIAEIKRTPMARLQTELAWRTVGPQLVTHVINAHDLRNDGVRVYPSHFFLPQHYLDSEPQTQQPIYCEHGWGSTEGTALEYAV